MVKDQSEPCDPNRCGNWSKSSVNFHHLQLQLLATLEVWGLWRIFCWTQILYNTVKRQLTWHQVCAIPMQRYCLCIVLLLIIIYCFLVTIFSNRLNYRGCWHHLTKTADSKLSHWSYAISDMIQGKDPIYSWKREKSLENLREFD